MIKQDISYLSLSRQCRLLGLSNLGALSSSEVEAFARKCADKKMQKRIDRIYTESAFFDSRQIERALRCEEVRINRKRVPVQLVEAKFMGFTLLFEAFAPTLLREMPAKAAASPRNTRPC